MIAEILALLMPGLKWLELVWKFVTSRFGSTLLLAIAAYIGGVRYEAHRTDARALREKVATLQRELSASRTINEDASERERQALRRAEDLRRQIDDAAQRIPPPRTVDDCYYGGPVVPELDRLRQLPNLPGSAGGGPSPVHIRGARGGS